MKKTLLFLLALSLSLTLVACGEETKKEENNENEIEIIDDNGGEIEFADPFEGYSSEYLDSQEGQIFQLLYHHYRANSDWIEEENDFEVKKVTNPRITVYTKEQLAENEELLKPHNIGDKDIVFESTVDLEISKKTVNMMKFTAGTGEIEGNTVKDKYECGILRSTEDGGYELELVGTSF